MTGKRSSGQKDATPANDRWPFSLFKNKKADALEAAYRDLAAFCEAIPFHYIGWHANGAQMISTGLPALVGQDDLRDMNAIINQFAAADQAPTRELSERLMAHGEGFDRIVSVPVLDRYLHLNGKRGSDVAGGWFNVIWISDVSDLVRVARQGADAAAHLSQKEIELRAALNALPFPVWTRDHDLNISWCNKFYASIVDDTTAAVIADQKEIPITGAHRGDTTQRILAQRALAKLAPQSMRSHVIVDGQRRYFEIVEIPMPHDKRGIGFAIDITKEEEWALSYERLSASQRESMEQLRTAISMFDADMRLEFYNASYEQMTGMPVQFLDAKPKMVEIIDKLRELRKLPELVDYKQYKQQWLNRFTSLIEPHEEMKYLPDGSVIRMIIVPRPMGGLIVTEEDVTSRLQLETSYNTLIAVQQETMDNLSEGIAVFGEDGRLRLSNQAFARMWKIPEEELSASTHISRVLDRAQALFTEENWPLARNIILGNALEREARRGRLSRANGTILEYAVVPLPDGNMLNAYFDITDSVRVEEALLEKNAALQEAERLKTDFLANVSYQLRTPLNAIMGFTEMLNLQYVGTLNERQLEYTGSMIEAGQRLVSLINDILDLSTIDAGYMNLYAKEINVAKMLEQVLVLTQDWARKQKLEMRVSAPESLSFMADDRRIKQVLLNLVSNAINYSPDGGRIEITGEDDGDSVILRVADNGLGIPAKDVTRVFTPFERIHDGKAQRRSGAGLGLSLVKSIVELHGGTVAIESEEGKGTTVICRLPKLSPQTQA